MVWRKLPNAILKQKHSITQHRILLRNQVRAFSKSNNNNNNNNNNSNNNDDKNVNDKVEIETENEEKPKSIKDSIQKAILRQKMALMQESIDRASLRQEEQQKKEDRFSEEDLLDETYDGHEVYDHYEPKELDDPILREMEEIFNDDTVETKQVGKQEQEEEEEELNPIPKIKINKLNRENEKMVKKLFENFEEKEMEQNRQYIPRDKLQNFGLMENDYDGEYPPFVNRETGAILVFDKVLNSYSNRGTTKTREELFSKARILESRYQSDPVVIVRRYLDASPPKIRDAILGNSELFDEVVNRIKLHQELQREKNRYSNPSDLSVSQERELATRVLAESGLFPPEVIAEINQPFLDKNLNQGKKVDPDFQLFENAKYYLSKIQKSQELDKATEDDRSNLFDTSIPQSNFDYINQVPINKLFDSYIASETYHKSGALDQVPEEMDFNGRDEYLRDQLRQYFFELSQRDKKKKVEPSNEKVYDPIPSGYEKYDEPYEPVEQREAEQLSFDEAFMEEYIQYKTLALPHENLRVQEILDDIANDVTNDYRSHTIAHENEVKSFFQKYYGVDIDEDDYFEQLVQKQTKFDQFEQEQEQEQKQPQQPQQQKKQTEQQSESFATSFAASSSTSSSSSSSSTSSTSSTSSSTSSSSSSQQKQQTSEKQEQQTSENKEEENINEEKEDEEKEIEREEEEEDEDEEMVGAGEDYDMSELDESNQEVDLFLDSDSDDDDDDEEGNEGEYVRMERRFNTDYSDSDMDTSNKNQENDYDINDIDVEEKVEEEEETEGEETEDKSSYNLEEEKEDLEVDHPSLDLKDPLYKNRVADDQVDEYGLKVVGDCLTKGDYKFLREMEDITDTLFLTLDENNQNNGDEVTFDDLELNDQLTLGDDGFEFQDDNEELAPFNIDDVNFSSTIDRSKMSKEEVIKSVLDEYSVIDLFQDEVKILAQLKEELPPNKYQTLINELKKDDDGGELSKILGDSLLEKTISNYRQSASGHQDSKQPKTFSYNGLEIDSEGNVIQQSDESGFSIDVKEETFNITHPAGFQKLETVLEEMELLDLIQGTYEEDLDLLRAEADMYARRTSRKIKNLAKKREFAKQMKVKQMEALKSNPPVVQPYKITPLRPVGHNIYTNVLAPPNSYLRLNDPKYKPADEKRNKEIIQESYRALSSNPFYGVKEANFAVKKINKELNAYEGYKKYRQYQLKNTKPTPSPILSKPTMLVEPDKLHEFNSFYREN
ncbi:hypothetical protein ACTA71_009454 [Dictyostelium dimigraforme]